MAKKVFYCKLHQGVWAPGGPGDLGSTLPPNNKTLALEMWYRPEGVEITLSGKKSMIPWGNVAIASFVEVPDEVPPPAPPAPEAPKAATAPAVAPKKSAPSRSKSKRTAAPRPPTPEPAEAPKPDDDAEKQAA